MNTLQDRIRGSLIGGAIADALGYPVEFIYSFEEIQARYGERGITRLDTRQHWLEDAEQVAEQVRNAGSVFIGNYSCESAGDYASGTNHTLPTNGYAKAYSGVCLDSFMKKITFQRLTPEGILTIGPAVMEMAHNEQLDAHHNAMAVRLKAVKEEN